MTLWSCDSFFDRVVDVEIEEHEPRITVFGYLDEEYDVHVIDVGQSAGYLEENPDKIRDATLKLFKNDIEIEGFYYSFDEYKLPSPLNGELGDEFRLEVEVPGIGKVTSETKVTPEFDVLSIEKKGEGYSIDDEEFFPEYEVIINDDSNENNYYAIEILRLDTVQLFTYSLTTLDSNDPNIHDWYLEGLVFNDNTFNGEEKKVQVFVKDSNGSLNENEAYLFIVKSITPELYQFARTYTNYRYNLNNPFAEPVTVYSNIENGFGVFSYIRNKRFYINE